ncbi:lysophospholipid acyltransferase family protein [Tropicimonas sp. S265A]|uniref:lysophospholipid acyltransferase family protein n=1 Tax=Tropicimonas sp. S265A TaxID=3415134 RepID=UPI003C79BD20
MSSSSRFVYLLTSIPLFVFLNLARVLPFRARVKLGGLLFGFAARVVSPVRARILENVKLARPEMADADARRFCSAVGTQIGRTLTEILFGEEHQKKHLPFAVSGPGLAAIEAAQEAGQPILLISAHFGQWDAARIHLRDKMGLEVGALFRPLNNPYLNGVWKRGISASGEPLIPKGREGLRDLLAQLRAGKPMAILADQYQMNGVMLPFLGHDAMTALAAAELALKFDAVLVPVFCIRADADNRVEVTFHAPLPHTTPEEMMRAFNECASAQIGAHPDQWLWPHRRWKT